MPGQQLALALGLTDSANLKPPDDTQSSPRPRRLAWAKLLARVFAIDVTICRKCGGRMRVLEVVDTDDDIARVLHGARAPPRPFPPGQVARVHRTTGAAENDDLDLDKFLARLCALVPPPGFHMTRYFGVFANRHHLRHRIIPSAAPMPGQQLGLADSANLKPPDDTQSSPRPRRLAWAKLLARRDRKQLERLCRYLLRPPFAHDAVQALPGGRVRVGFKAAWRSGAAHADMSADKFLARLCALVPPPGFHMTA